MLSRKAHTKRIITELSLEGYTIANIALELEERGITASNGTRIGKKKVSNILRAVEAEWRENTQDNIETALARQQAELQHVKSKLHEEGDYKTLIRYLDLEHKILAPKQTVQNIRTQNNMFVSAAERIAALQLAAESEADIESAEYEVVDAEYVEEARQE